MTDINLSQHILEELVASADACILTGRRLRSDPGTHELSLAALCNVLGRIAEQNPDLVEP